MFGYLTADIGILNKEQRTEYKSFYCGLCKTLSKHYGTIGRMTLTYDLTFVSMVLNAVYNKPTVTYYNNCVLHPLRSIKHNITEFHQYCADMNILLTYYKCVDDINDENSSKAIRKSEKLKPFVESIEKKYPEKSQLIKVSLQTITKMENDNVLNPDLPSKEFGKIMAEIFIVEENEYSPLLRGFGFNIGRFIYLVDAICDLKNDIKNQQYNPLISLENFDEEGALQLILEDVDYFYNQLPIHSNKDLIDNVVYSGLWTQFDIHKKKKEKEMKR